MSSNLSNKLSLSFQEAACQAVEDGVHIVGISSQAAGHKTLAPQLMSELRDISAGNIVVICGGIIPKNVAVYDDLAAFVNHIITQKQ